ncbi:hypothetical protein C1645_840681 [Glomus cerebriforme]|uniref:Uncharacterized protein n=1 Tax=Glomus cerebriforme TaxID=658196 RepID=A0A397RZ40_9GLOM|nr:hypothetical protein C1645_840681 [Glomus cerebriforme]
MACCNLKEVLMKKLLKSGQNTSQSRELNAKLLAEIAKLKKENAKIFKLRRILRLRIRMLRSLILEGSYGKSKKCDIENAKLKVRIEKLVKNKTVTTKLGSSNFNSVTDQLPMIMQHDKEMNTSLSKELIPEVIAKQSVSAIIIPESVAVKLNRENGAVPEVITVPANSKSSEEKEMDKFLDEKVRKIKKISSRNQQKVIQDFNNSDEIKLTKNQYIEFDLIQDLQSGSIIALPVNNNFENKIVKICHETGIIDKTARTQIYKKMLEFIANFLYELDIQDTIPILKQYINDDIKKILEDDDNMKCVISSRVLKYTYGIDTWRKCLANHSTKMNINQEITSSCILTYPRMTKKVYYNQEYNGKMTFGKMEIIVTTKDNQTGKLLLNIS